jgi:hypothetical protein
MVEVVEVVVASCGGVEVVAGWWRVVVVSRWWS